MNTLPLTNERVATRGGLRKQTPHRRALDSNAEHDLRPTTRAEQVDLGLSGANDMEMGRIVIERVDDEPEAMRAMRSRCGATPWSLSAAAPA
jgi:hypothetical protein